MTLDFMATLKASIHNQKYTKDTKIHLHLLSISPKNFFLKDFKFNEISVFRYVHGPPLAGLKFYYNIFINMIDATFIYNCLRCSKLPVHSC